MKKPFYIIAAALAAVCVVGAAGCKSNTVSRAVLSSNWYSGTGFGGFQPTIIKGNENFEEDGRTGAEKITYAVTHTPLEEKYRNKYYSVAYGENSTYTTEFYAEKFNASAYGYPEEYKAAYAEAGEIIAYCYKTTLDISSVTYTLNATKKHEEQTETFTGDKIVTECRFLAVKDYLRPLYSKQTVKSVSPNMLQPSELKDGAAYKKYDRVYESFYSYSGSAVTTVTTDKLAQGEQTKTAEVSLAKAKNSLFDLNCLDILARAQNLSVGSKLAQAVSLYIPKSGTVENFNFAGSTAPLVNGEDELKQLKSRLEARLGEKGLYIPAENGLQTVAASLHYNNAQPGGSQTYWFAAINDKRNNTGRATMLKLAQPISYNLGTISYTLESFQSNLWNG